MADLDPPRRSDRWPGELEAIYAGVSGPPQDAVHVPWTPLQVSRLNRRQEDERAESYRCPRDQIDLFATRYGWICGKSRCGFRQYWALAQDILDEHDD